VFDEGTTERNVRYYDVQDEDADLDGKEFVSLHFYSTGTENVLAFLDKDGDTISTKTTTYDGQYFTFLASYSYKETDELGNEVEVSINKLTKIIALYGIDQDDIQIYESLDKVLQEDANGLMSVDKNTINVELATEHFQFNCFLFGLCFVCFIFAVDCTKCRSGRKLLLNISICQCASTRRRNAIIKRKHFKNFRFTHKSVNYLCRNFVGHTDFHIFQ
jgi:hypothetical protein